MISKIVISKIAYAISIFTVFPVWYFIAVRDDMKERFPDILEADPRDPRFLIASLIFVLGIILWLLACYFVVSVIQQAGFIIFGRPV